MNPLQFIKRLARPPTCATCRHECGGDCVRPPRAVFNYRTGLMEQRRPFLSCSYEREWLSPCGITARFWERRETS